VKHLTPWGRVIVAIELICDFLVVPPFRTKPAYRVIQELLILGIGCNPEIGKTDFYRKSEVNISVGRVDCLTTEQIYPTVTERIRTVARSGSFFTCFSTEFPSAPFLFGYSAKKELGLFARSRLSSREITTDLFEFPSILVRLANYPTQMFGPKLTQ